MKKQRRVNLDKKIKELLVQLEIAVSRNDHVRAKQLATSIKRKLEMSQRRRTFSSPRRVSSNREVNASTRRRVKQLLGELDNQGDVKFINRDENSIRRTGIAKIVGTIEMPVSDLTLLDVLFEEGSCVV